MKKKKKRVSISRDSGGMSGSWPLKKSSQGEHRKQMLTTDPPRVLPHPIPQDLEWAGSQLGRIKLKTRVSSH